MFGHRAPWARLCVVGSFGLVAALAGCSADQTAILLELESPNLVVPTDVAQVRVLAMGESGVMADVTSDLPGTWPQTFAIRPGAGRADELVSIRVYGLAGGRERIRRVLAPVRFTSGSTTRVSVILDRDCLDVICTSPDVGCLAGVCQGEMPMDGGVDGGTDGGTIDAGDAGDEDGGMPDGGDEDAGTDAGSDAGTDAGMAGEGRLLITEYVEGSSFNKALEITNVGDGAISLIGCEVQLYSNGGTTAGNSLALNGMLEPGQSIVYCHPSHATGATCAATSLAINFSGDDAVALVCMGVVTDTFGRIGERPTPAWTGGGLSSQDRTLRRKCDVTMGDVDGSDAFDPSVEWDGFPPDTFGDLGMRVCPG
ncbi:MAG: lamin tail domain-containing protein [Myxococcota bacterium]|jgi:hypothetical protein|nr:lamin tail domain-containing protein [Myxococcota bacterium]